MLNDFFFSLEWFSIAGGIRRGYRWDKKLRMAYKLNESQSIIWSTAIFFYLDEQESERGRMSVYDIENNNQKSESYMYVGSGIK